MITNELMKTVLDALPRLSPEQRSEVRGKLRALDAMDGGSRIRQFSIPDPEHFSNRDFVFDGLMMELGDRGLISSAAIPALKRSKCYKVYSSKVSPVAELLFDPKHGIPNQTTIRLALCRLAAKCLCDDVLRWATLSPSLVLANVDKIPEAIEKAFPGYLSNGLLKQLVLRSTGSSFIGQKNNVG